LVIFVNSTLTMTKGPVMFRYHHPHRSFGTRSPGTLVGRTPAGADLRFFVGAYVAGTTFALAYLL
jgi:hypothetical protein